jgi:hypothetical protein
MAATTTDSPYGGHACFTNSPCYIYTCLSANHYYVQVIHCYSSMTFTQTSDALFIGMLSAKINISVPTTFQCFFLGMF